MGGEEAVSDDDEINWKLIERLSTKPHKHLNIVEGAQYGAMIDGKFEDCCNGINELMQEARNVHHLLDLAGIPEGKGYRADIDARTYLAIRRIQDAEERLERIADWHSRMSGPGGTFDDYCNECREPWPCATRAMAEGNYVGDGPS